MYKMFPLLLLTVILIVPKAIKAEEVADETTFCASIAELARNIMTIRQNGVPMTKAMEVVQAADPSIRDLVRSLTIAAYEAPQFSGEEYRNREILDFENKVVLQCYKADF